MKVWTEAIYWIPHKHESPREFDRYLSSGCILDLRSKIKFFVVEGSAWIETNEKWARGLPIYYKIATLRQRSSRNFSGRNRKVVMVWQKAIYRIPQEQESHRDFGFYQEISFAIFWGSRRCCCLQPHCLLSTRNLILLRSKALYEARVGQGCLYLLLDADPLITIV